MPIKPENLALYPANWKSEIRPRILERAGNCCERCGVENHAIGWRNDAGVFQLVEPNGNRERLAELQHDYGDVFRLLLVVLTIAHVHDHDPANCADDNLQALCQRCHLLLDAPMHREHRAATHRAKRAAADLFEQRASS